METLAWFVDNLVTSEQKSRPFLLKIVAKGMCSNKTHGAINKMYRTWKKNGKGKFRSVGRPAAISVEEVQQATDKVLKDKLNDSNTFKLKHMKEMMATKKKEITARNGPDPDTTKISVSLEWAKANMSCHK